MAERKDSFASQEITHPDNIPTFGSILKAVREGYGKRMRNDQVTRVRFNLAAVHLLEGLHAEGLPMVPGAYSEIEASHTLPRHPWLFIAALARTLDLNSGEIKLLAQSYSLDLIKQKGFMDAHTRHALTSTAESRDAFKANVASLRQGGRLSEVTNEKERLYFYIIKEKVKTKQDEQRIVDGQSL